LLGLTLVALFLAVVVASWLRANTHTTAPPKPSAPLDGTLVYAGAYGADRTRLWVWDLRSGEVEAGPIVDRPLELVNARAANFGWIGLTSELPGGASQGSVLRFLGPDDQPVPMVRGDLVTWDARGESVVGATRGPVLEGCRRITVVHVNLIPLVRDRQFDRRTCGDLISIGRDGARTYFTLERSGRVSSFFAGYQALHRILPRYALVAVSAVGDMVVVPASELTTTPISPFPVREGDPTGPIAGAALFFNGLQADGPIPYGQGGDRFAIDRVLAWSFDSLHALASGRLGNVQGLFELDGGPGDGLRPPRYVGPIEGSVWATYAEDGTAVVEIGGAFFALRAGRLIPMELPIGAPGPSGPIVWMP
jgi:hypothetical protein